MNKVQTSKSNSLVKIEDFLDDHAAELAVVVQIEPLHEELKDVIEDIGTAMALAEQDNTGYTINKNLKVNEVKRLILKVGRGATAYYQSINEFEKLSISNYKKSELDSITESRLSPKAKQLYKEALPIAANLIGADAADVAALQAAALALDEIIEDPSRAIDVSKRYNDSIDGLLKRGDEIRNKIDVYMQTFIDENPGLYAEWKLSMAIDDMPTHGSPDFTTPISCAGGGAVTTVDYIPLGGLFGSTNIEFTLPQNIPQGVRAGFGVDDQSILAGKELQLTGGSSNRRSAASLGFDLNSAPFLNIINDTMQVFSVTVDFYTAD